MAPAARPPITGPTGKLRCHRASAGVGIATAAIATVAATASVARVFFIMRSPLLRCGEIQHRAGRSSGHSSAIAVMVAARTATALAFVKCPTKKRDIDRRQRVERPTVFYGIASPGNTRELNRRISTAVTLNRRAYEHAKELIDEGRFVFDERDAWSEHQPSAKEENEYIRLHGFAEYGKWYLGVNDEKPQDTKGHHEFPYGDFKKAHRCGLLVAESR